MRYQKRNALQLCPWARILEIPVKDAVFVKNTRGNNDGINILSRSLLGTKKETSLDEAGRIMLHNQGRTVKTRPRGDDEISAYDPSHMTLEWS